MGAEQRRLTVAYINALHERLRDTQFHRKQIGLDGEAYAAGDMTVIWSIATELDKRLWLHVSVSRPNRLPSYSDMARVKAHFIGPDATAYSVWLPESLHVNIHPNCLHLWSPLEGDPPLPEFSRGMGTI